MVTTTKWMDGLVETKAGLRGYFGQSKKNPKADFGRDFVAKFKINLATLYQNHCHFYFRISQM